MSKQNVSVCLSIVFGIAVFNVARDVEAQIGGLRSNSRAWVSPPVTTYYTQPAPNVVYSQGSGVTHQSNRSTYSNPNYNNNSYPYYSSNSNNYQSGYNSPNNVYRGNVYSNQQATYSNGNAVYSNQQSTYSNGSPVYSNQQSFYGNSQPVYVSPNSVGGTSYYVSPSQARGAAVGSAIGGAIGGQQGANIGAAIGVQSGRP